MLLVENKDGKKSILGEGEEGYVQSKGSSLIPFRMNLASLSFLKIFWPHYMACGILAP